MFYRCTFLSQLLSNHRFFTQDSDSLSRHTRRVSLGPQAFTRSEQFFTLSKRSIAGLALSLLWTNSRASSSYSNAYKTRPISQPSQLIIHASAVKMSPQALIESSDLPIEMTTPSQPPSEEEMVIASQPPPEFSRLPLELRQKIYEQFFRSLCVQFPHLRDLSSRSCFYRKRSRSSSACNLLRVSKQIYEEANPYFMRHTTFYMMPRCCWDVVQPLPFYTAGLRHLVVTDEHIGGLAISSRESWEILNHCMTAVAHVNLANAKLATLRFDWIFLFKEHKGIPVPPLYTLISCSDY